MPLKIGEILDNVYDNDLGWRPASGSIKPVHLANGLVRELQGGYYNLDVLHEFVVWWRKGKVVDDERTLEHLLEDPEWEARIGCYAGRRQEFERFRRYALGLLNTDRGLFPSLDHSSFSLTAGVMVTRSTNDRKLGAFAAALCGKEGGGAGLADVLRECFCSDRPRDPISAMVWPLLPAENALQRPAKGTDSEKGTARALRRPFQKEILSALQEASCALATHEAEQGNRLRSLQRAVLFASVATVSHAQALAADGKLAQRKPGVLAINGHKRSEMAVVSERSVSQMLVHFERWLTKRLAVLLREGRPLTSGEPAIDVDSDGRSVRAMLRKILDSKGRSPSDELLGERMAAYAQAKRAFPDADAAELIAITLVDCYLQEYESGGPRPFLQTLARRAGLLFPHFQGRSREKRLRPSVAVMDMLVRACVRSDEAVSLEEFLKRLWTRFGLILGGRRTAEWDDVEFLADHGLATDPKVLQENTESFVDELGLMGLGRRFADGVTFLGEANVC